MKRVLILLLCISALFYAVCNKNKNQTADEQTGSSATNQVTAGGVTLRWAVDAGWLAVTVTATTTGWVAVGFNPGIGMQDANIVIGYVSSGAVVMRDDFGTGLSSHSADIALGGTDNITATSGSEINGLTELNFKIPLNSGDSKDQALVAGNTYKVILAYGSADDFTTQHAARASANIKIQ